MTDYVRVMDFGAVGNGVANDRPKIQKAIDAIADRGGGDVLFPRDATKQFLIDRDSLKVYPGITLASESLPTDPHPCVRNRIVDSIPTLVRPPGGPKYLVEIVPRGSSSADHRIRFLRLRFRAKIGRSDSPPDGDRKPGNFRVIIGTTGVGRVDVRGCAFDFEPGDGIEFWGYTNLAILAQDCSDVRVDYCELTKCQIKCGGGSGGIEDVRISSNRFVSPHNFAVSAVARTRNAVVSKICIAYNEVITINEGGILIGDDMSSEEQGDIELREIDVRMNYFGGEWKSKPSDQSGGGEPKGVIVRYGATTRDINIIHNICTSTVRAIGSYGIFCGHRDREFNHSVDRVRIVGNMINKMDHHGIAVDGKVNGLVVSDNVVSDTRGVSIRASKEGGSNGEFRRNQFPSIFNGRRWLVLNAENQSIGPLFVADIPTSMIRCIGPFPIDVRR